MNKFEKDFKRLYLLQDKVMQWVNLQDSPFYLTGGTALGRFYLNHRHSEDLDYFVNANISFKDLTRKLYANIKAVFTVDDDTVFEDDFTRLYIIEDTQILKVEFVNDVASFVGKQIQTASGKIDSVENILANKLSALIGRDEPKDLFDIIHIAWEFEFNWKEVFLAAKE